MAKLTSLGRQLNHVRRGTTVSLDNPNYNTITVLLFTHFCLTHSDANCVQFNNINNELEGNLDSGGHCCVL